MSLHGGKPTDLVLMKPCQLCGGEVRLEKPFPDDLILGTSAFPKIKCRKCKVVFSFDNPRDYSSSLLGSSFSLIQAFNRRCADE